MREVEKAYLGAAIVDPAVLDMYPIAPEDMQGVVNQQVYSKMRELYRNYGTFDYMVLSESLPDVPPAELAELVTMAVSSMNANVYADQIRKKAEKRDILAIASAMANDAAHGELDHLKYVEQITRSIRVTGATDSLQDVAKEYAEYLEQRELNPSDVWGIPTPSEKLNKITGGLHRKESVLVFGESGLGKTVFVLQCGYHAAALGYKVDFYEMEMSRRNLMSRLVAMRSKVTTRKMHAGKMSDFEKAKVMDALTFIKGLPIRISDQTHWTSSEIRADQQKKNGDRADVVIVDYLALLQDRAENAYERVEMAAKNLRQMAKDLDQVVITVGSQVKDGTIKGTAEVKYTQDMTLVLESPDADKNSSKRDLVPDKIRNEGDFRRVALVFETTDDNERLPMFKESVFD